MDEVRRKRIFMTALDDIDRAIINVDGLLNAGGATPEMTLAKRQLQIAVFWLKEHKRIKAEEAAGEMQEEAAGAMREASSATKESSR